MGDMNEELGLRQLDLQAVQRIRHQAETMRDQLAVEYQRLTNEPPSLPNDDPEMIRWARGVEALRKAIKASDHAIAGIDQALREQGQFREE